jgi:hypothetical protein
MKASIQSVKKYLYYTALLIPSLLFLSSCKGENSKNKIKQSKNASDIKNKNIIKVEPAKEFKKDPTDFVPKEFIVFEKIYGDLNNDSTIDCILIIKATDKSQIITDENKGKLDKNRRGIIVLLNHNNSYELLLKNYDCFSSENEDGGVYYPPELSVEIDQGKLFIQYSHGRYGYWGFTFRLQNSDLELIGYDASSTRGPVVQTETSINYLSKKKIVSQNSNENADSGEEIFKKSTSKISVEKLIKLSEIKDFDELEILNL